MLFFTQQLAKGTAKHATSPSRAQSASAPHTGELGGYTGLRMLYLTGLPLWGCLFFMCEQPAPGLWVLLREIQRKKTHWTHPVLICADPLRPWLQEPGSQDLGTFKSRICGFKVCPGKNVLCPAARMRRLRRHWTSAAGDTGTHPGSSIQALLPQPAAHPCSFTAQLHPTHSYSVTAPDPLVYVSATTFCDVGRPGRLRR